MNVVSSITQAAMRNRQVVVTVTSFLVLYGLYALFVMPRQEFPEFIVRQGVIVGVFPGASSTEVEDRLTSKVESYLFSYEEVDRSRTYSISEEGMMYLFVELRPEVTDADLFWATIRHGLRELKASLPQEVLALVANNRFGDAAAVMLTVHSDQRSYKELEEYLELLEDRLRALPSVSTINHYGLQREQISIYFDSETLALYGIRPSAILAALRLEGSVSYAGSLDDGRVDLPIHLPGRYETESDLARQIVYADPRGSVVRLGDVARVVREYPDPDSYIQIDGAPCVVITLEMMDGHNIVHFGREVDAVMADALTQLPPDIRINTIADMPQAVSHSVGDFIKEFFIAIVAVIAVTMVLLPLRVASIAALTIPISVLAALGVLYAIGIELHTVSLAALIVVLGMVVDNTVVIIDDHIVQLDHGLDPWTAAWKSVTDLFVPVVSATLAIIAVFVPMNIYLTGLAGDFVEPFPATIIITLGISLVVAVLLVPIMTHSWIRQGLNHDDHEGAADSMLVKMQAGYDRLIEAAFRHRPTVLASAVGILVLTGVLAANITSQMGPKVDRDQFAVEIYLAEGSALDRTAQAVDSLQAKLLADPRVTHVTAFVGTSSPRFHTLYAPQMPAPNYAQLIVNTTSVDATVELVRESEERFAVPMPEAYFRWRQIEFTEASAPLEVRLSGAPNPVLKQAATQVEELLREEEGVTWIRRDYKDPLQAIRLVVNEDEANRLGLTKGLISYTVAAAMEGLPMGTVWEGDYPVSIVLYQNERQASSLGDLEGVFVTSPFSGGSVRARHLVRPVMDQSDGRIIRRNGVETLGVVADVANDASAFRIFNRVSRRIRALDLPDGVSVSYGGEHESEIRNYTPFAYSLATSIGIIFFILLFQFRTVRLSLLVMSTIPLSVFGAVLGLLLMRYPFGMTAFVGLISLVGMVIRNGVIYVDYAETLRIGQGMDLRTAALAAGKRRMRPIFLTSMAAAVGVIPMILSRAPLWGPLGAVICFGLLFTMVLSLVVLPVLYSVAGPRTHPSGPRGAASSPAPAIAGLLLILTSTLTLATPASAQQTLTLERSLELALENNVALRNSVEERAAARHVRKKALTSWFPTISATGTAFRADNPLVEYHSEEENLPVYDGNPANLDGASQFAFQPSTYLGLADKGYVGALTLTQPLFAGGRILNGNRLAALGVEVEDTRHELIRARVVTRTEAQYWQLVSLDEKLRTVDAYRRFLTDLDDQVTQAREVGLVLETDMLTVRLRAQELELDRRQLANARRLALMAFCQELGIAFQDDLVLSSELGDAPQAMPRLDHRAILDQRPEYALLQASVRAARLETSLAVGKQLPAVAIGVSGYRMSIDDRDPVTNAVGFLSVEIPISGWWGGSHEIAEQKNRARAAENTASDAEEKLLLEMDKAWTDLEEARERVSVATSARELAQENADVSRDAYRNGLITVSDLLEAEAALVQASDRWVDARIGLRLKVLEYQRVTGGM